MHALTLTVECKEKLRKSLVLMGEIGGNDYNFAFFQGRTMEEAYQLVPDVVRTIKDGIKVSYIPSIPFVFYFHQTRHTKVNCS